MDASPEEPKTLEVLDVEGPHRGFRYGLKPTARQAEVLGQWAGVTRLVFNLCLQQRRDFWRQYQRHEGRSLNWMFQSREVTDLRGAYDWIAAVPRNPLDLAVQDLDRAFQAFFSGGSGYPRPRTKGLNDTMRFRATDVRVKALNAKWSSVRLPKLGWVKFRDTRPLLGETRDATVSLRSGEWFISFTQIIRAPTRATMAATVGVDRGVAQTLTLSTGEAFQAPAGGRLLTAHKKAQRVLARRKKGSRRRMAARLHASRLSAQIARQRTDWCHRTSADIARRFGMVAIESLNIKNMTASAAGTVAEPGRNVAQKRGLNRSILAQCWGKFTTQLAYKLDERGGSLISVPAAYTSQTCACCGVVDARSRESQAVFKCVHCDHTDNADVNAAKEILRRSTAWLDMEAEVARLAKCQPGRQPEPASPGMLRVRELEPSRQALEPSK